MNSNECKHIQTVNCDKVCITKNLLQPYSDDSGMLTECMIHINLLYITLNCY